MSLLDIIFDLLSFDFIDWYSQQFVFLPRNILEFLVSWFIYYIIIQLLTYILPFLRNLLYFFGAPFRYVHVWLHIWAAQRFKWKSKDSLEGYSLFSEDDSENEEKNTTNNSTTVRSAFFTGIGTADSSRLLIREPRNGREALIIAGAPLIGAIPLFFFLVISAKYFAALGSSGVLIHSYFSTVTLGVSMPTARDFQFYTNTSLVESRVSPLFVIWVYAVFIINLYLEVARTENLLLGVVSGLVWSFAYLSLLFVVVRFLAPAPRSKKKGEEEELTIFRPLDEQPSEEDSLRRKHQLARLEGDVLLFSEGDDIY